MDERIFAALRSKDPDQRRKGILAAGKSGDAVYLKTLNHLIYTDDSADLRELAQKASQHIRAKGGDTSAPASASRRSAPKVARPPAVTRQPEPANVPPASAEPKQPRKSRYSVGRLIPFVLFVVVVMGAGALFLWLAAGDSVSRQLYLDSLNTRMGNAPSLPRDGTRAANVLNGQLFRSQTSPNAEFFIQEPTGTMPAGGWPIVMCVAGGTPRSESCFGWMGERAANEKVLFISPSFYMTTAGGEGWSASIAGEDTRIFLNDLDAYYLINWRHSVMYGFSAGASFTAYYTGIYTLDFAGAVLGGFPGYEALPPTDSPVRYGVITGEFDSRLTIANEFTAEMAGRGTPVWREETVSGAGHDVTIADIDMIFDLMRELSASP